MKVTITLEIFSAIVILVSTPTYPDIYLNSPIKPPLPIIKVFITFSS